MRPLLVLFALLAPTLAVVPLPAAAQGAPTFHVTTTADAAPQPANCISGTGTCSLRAAVIAANQSATPGVVIVVPAGIHTLQLPGADDHAGVGDLDIRQVMTIRGAGPDVTTIDAAGLDRVFDVRDVAAFALEAVTVTGGLSPIGSGLFVGPGVTADLRRVTVSGNTSTGAGGGLEVFSGTVTLIDSEVSANAAQTGGGITVQTGGTLEVRRSLVARNEAVGQGAGLQIANGTLTMSDSTISGNRTTGDTQGSALLLVEPALTVDLTRVTIADNAAASGFGQVRIFGSDNGPGSRGYDVTFTGVVIDGPEAGCSNGNGIVSGGGNVTFDATCPLDPPAPGDPADLQMTDPTLGPLEDNGGPTDTHALLDGSAAIGAYGTCTGTDQRGLPRTAPCDAGAFEVQPPPPAAQPNRRPIADAGGPYDATVDVPVTLDATGSRDPDGDQMSFAWDLDGDGHFDDATGATPDVIFDAVGERTIAVRVTDAGGRSSTDPATVTVTAPDVATTRLVADDAVASAIAWSRVHFPDQVTAHGVAQARPRTVLLGRDDLFADSLASAGAQGILGAPLLLTGSAAVDPRVLVELERLAPDRVLLLGGDAALAAPVAQQVHDAGFEVDRVAGASRLETAVALAELLAPRADEVVLTRAYAGPADGTQAFADALAAGGLAAQLQAPMLLTETDRLSASTRAHLLASGATRVVVVGGSEAVSETVRQELQALGLILVDAQAADRSGTAVAVARVRGYEIAALAGSAVLVDGYSARAWADAFPAALTSARDRAPVVLADGPALPPATAAWLDGGRVALVCGTTVTSQACDAAASALARTTG